MVHSAQPRKHRLKCCYYFGNTLACLAEIISLGIKTATPFLLLVKNVYEDKPLRSKKAACSLNIDVEFNPGMGTLLSQKNLIPFQFFAPGLNRYWSCMLPKGSHWSWKCECKRALGSVVFLLCFLRQLSCSLLQVLLDVFLALQGFLAWKFLEILEFLQECATILHTHYVLLFSWFPNWSLPSVINGKQTIFCCPSWPDFSSAYNLISTVSFNGEHELIIFIFISLPSYEDEWCRPPSWMTLGIL